VSPVLKEDDEAEGKKYKKDQPKQSANQRHGREGNLVVSKGQRGQPDFQFTD